MTDVAGIAARMFPGMAPDGPPAVAQGAPPSPAGAADPASPSSPTTSTPAPEASPRTLEEVGRDMYPTMGVATYGYVDWREAPPGTPSDYDLTAPPGSTIRDGTPEGEAAEARFRAALVQAGVGKTLAADLWRDAVEAEAGGRRYSPAETERELRSAWGSRYDAKMRAVVEVLTPVVRASPETLSFLKATGLIDNPAFVKKVAAFAATRGKR